MRKVGIVLAMLAVAYALVSATGCGGAGPTQVILSTTTSTQDSGLLDALLPIFEKQYNHTVKTVAVGSGEAIKMGERGDADVVLAHDRAAEEKAVAAGYLLERVKVMYNDFIIVGPAADPAKIKGDASSVDAFAKIAAAKSVFVSRGDTSGTYTKEASIWASATVDPKGQAWYLSTGQGMGETLQVANEKHGYTLVDRATWLTNADKNPELTLLLEGETKLFNPYHVILIPGAKNAAGAKAFEDWIVGADGQKVIGEFGVAQFGQQIFVPNANAAN